MEVCWGFENCRDVYSLYFFPPTPNHQQCRASQNPQPSRGASASGSFQVLFQEPMMKFTRLSMGICNVLVPSPCNTNMTCGTVASPFLTDMKFSTHPEINVQPWTAKQAVCVCVTALK